VEAYARIQSRVCLEAHISKLGHRKNPPIRFPRQPRTISING
jgi:hypothetical protein